MVNVEKKFEPTLKDLSKKTDRRGPLRGHDWLFPMAAGCI
jgi:hypothetical protein